jgi:hypothetical protein
MSEMVEARRNADELEQRHDLFSGLLEAAQDEPDNGGAITDQELMGKCSDGFTFLEMLTRFHRKHVYLSSCWT